MDMKVENRKIIRKLTWRSLKAGKLRNLIAVIAIALTATLFTTIFAIGGNMLQSMQDATMRQVGSRSHGGLKYLTQAQYDNLVASAHIKDISYSILVGGADNAALQKKQTEIRYAEDDFARWGFSYPTTGTMPQEKLELACSTITLDALGIPHELGQTVRLEFTVHGKSYSEEFTLCGFWEGDDVMVATQVWLSRAYVDTILSVPKSVDRDAGFDAVIGTINADVWFVNSIDITGKMDQLIAERGYAPEDITTGINWAYMGSEIDLTTAVMVMVLLLLILISGYLIIYSIFSISVTGDIKFYGLLKTIGATGKQLRRIVRGQALVLSALGIPLGLITGFLIGWVLTPYVIGITNLSESTISISPFIFIFSALFSLLTVLISCRKPGRIAARVAPVEAVRYTDAPSRSKRKGRKAHRVSPLSMAWANVGRSPKKLTVVLVSLSLSLILMNSVYSIVQGFDMNIYLKDQIKTDFSVSDASLYNFMTLETDCYGVDTAFLEELQALPGLEDSSNIHFWEDYTHELSANIYESAKDTLHALEEDFDGEIPLHIYGVGKLAMSLIAEEHPDLDIDKLFSGDYAFISHIRADENKEYQPLYTIGDKIPLKNQDGEMREVEVIGYMDYPYLFSIMHSHMIDSDVIIAENLYKDFYGDTQPMMTIFDVQDDKLTATEEWLAYYCEAVNFNMTYRSREFYRAEFEQMQNTFLACGGALAGILFLIGILNFVNTCFTSIIARRRELAMLQSVGMTGRQMRQMLFAEGSIYATLTIVLSATAGSLLGYCIVQTIAGQIWYFNWNFTLLPLMVCILPLMLICVAIPVICYHFMQKESVVERLRTE